jgi:hypothetical protein
MPMVQQWRGTIAEMDGIVRLNLRRASRWPMVSVP